MRIHSPDYQRRLKRAAMEAIRESPDLRKEYRLARKGRRLVISPMILRIAITFVLINLVWILRQRGADLQTQLAWIAIWTLASVVAQSQILRTALLRNRDVIALRLLPVSDEFIFQRQFRNWLLQFIKTLLDVLIAYGLLGFYYHITPWAWPVIPLLAIVTWLTMLSLVPLYFTRIAPKVSQAIYSVSYLVVTSGFVILVVHIKRGQMIPAYVAHFAPSINLLLPTGWCLSLFPLLLHAGQSSRLWLLLPAGLVILTLKRSIAVLRETVSYREYIPARVPDIIPNAQPGEPAHNVGLTEIEEVVESRAFLDLTPSTPRRFLERQFWRWLTPRQRILCEFAFPNGYAITLPAIKFLRNMAAIIAIGFCIAQFNPDFKPPTVVIIYAITIIYALGLFAGSGRAFSAIMNGGIKIPIYAHFGIAFWELASLLVKCAAVQFFVLTPLLSLIAVLFAVWAHLSMGTAIVFGIKTGFVLFASRLALLASAFGSGTNDTSRFRLAAAGAAIFFIVLGFAMVGLSIASFLVPGPAFAWLALLAAVLDGAAIMGIYGWYYGRARFDLMSISK